MMHKLILTIKINIYNMEIYETSKFEFTPEQLKELTDLFEIYKLEIPTVIIPNQYIGLIDNHIICYCIIINKKCLFDKKSKYFNKKRIDIVKISDNKLKNTFDLIDLNCMYNLIRNKDEKYKGQGIIFVKNIYKLFQYNLYLATTENKLYHYYLSCGFKPTQFYDKDTNNIFQQILHLQEK